MNNLQKKLGIKFKKPELLEEALTHRSFLNEKKGVLRHNERLEFLGDAVLELIVTDFLFKKFPEKNEGELTSLRASLVNSEMLFNVAEKIKLHDYLKLSKGEAKDSGKGRQIILANALEAVIGAIYLDGGYGKTADFVEKHISSNIGRVLDKKLWRDAKSFFQEKAQGDLGFTPVYSVLEESGPDHKKHFVIGVYLDEELVATGEGFSKQEAEMDAAKKALAGKGWHGD